jgi:hypothetical protein
VSYGVSILRRVTGRSVGESVDSGDEGDSRGGEGACNVRGGKDTVSKERYALGGVCLRRVLSGQNAVDIVLGTLPDFRSKSRSMPKEGGVYGVG